MTVNIVRLWKPQDRATGNIHQKASYGSYWDVWMLRTRFHADFGTILKVWPIKRFSRKPTSWLWKNSRLWKTQDRATGNIHQKASYGSYWEIWLLRTTPRAVWGRVWGESGRVYSLLYSLSTKALQSIILGDTSVLFTKSHASITILTGTIPGSMLERDLGFGSEHFAETMLTVYNSGARIRGIFKNCV